MASENLCIPVGGTSALAEADQKIQVRLSLQQEGADAYPSGGFPEGGASEGQGVCTAPSGRVDPDPLHDQGDDSALMDAVLASNQSNECADIILKVMLLSKYFPPYTCRMPGEDSSVPWINVDGREACDHLNSMVANMAFNVRSGIAEDEAIVFRKALWMAKHVLGNAVSSPTVFANNTDIGEGDVYRLNICMLDLLRSLRSAVSFGVKEGEEQSLTKREYSRTCRSAESQGACTMCNFMRSEDSAMSDTYAIADAMHTTFNMGLAKLGVLCDWPLSPLVAFLDTGKQSVRSFLNSFIVPSIFDNNRMRCANAIAARFYGNSAHTFGKAEYVYKVFGSSSDLVSISRVVYTICALISMAIRNITEAADEVVMARLKQKAAESGRRFTESLSAEQNARAQAIRNKLVIKERNAMPLWTEACNMLTTFENTVKTHLSEKNDSPGANAKVMTDIANWFEDAIHDAAKFSVITCALAYDSFCIARPAKQVRKQWREFRRENGQYEKPCVSLWFASQFLVTSRLERHDPSVSGSNIITEALVVMSGAIAHMASTVTVRDQSSPGGVKQISPVCGPFKFSPSIEKEIRDLYKRFGERLQRHSICYDSGVKVDLGNKCAMNENSRRILEVGKVRNQNEASGIVDTRLKACLFWTTVKESLDADLGATHELLHDTKQGVTASPSEGRKGLRRLYIISLQTLPCLKFATCRTGNVPHVIEQCRKSPNNHRTTDDNVEKSWRDINGGSLVGTFFFPTAGVAFVSTLRSLVNKYGPDTTPEKLLPDSDDDDDTAEKKERDRDHYETNFECKTKQAINAFAECFEERVRRTFPRSAVVRPTEGLVKEDYGRAATILSQHVSICMNFSKCIRDCAPIWEDIHMIFCVQKDKAEKAKNPDDQGNYMLPQMPRGMQPLLATYAAGAGSSSANQEEDDDDDDLWDDPVGAGAGSSSANQEEDDDDDLWDDPVGAGAGSSSANQEEDDDDDDLWDDPVGGDSGAPSASVGRSAGDCVEDEYDQGEAAGTEHVDKRQRMK